MAVKDLDTPLHRLMEYLGSGDYARMPKEFTDFVKEDFEEKVEEVQIYSNEKRSFVFLKSFIDKMRRKQYKAAKEHLTAARQEYEKFMLQYESLPPRKKPSAIKPYPQPKDNERKPAVVPNEETSPGYWAPPPAKSSIQPVYSTPLPQHVQLSLRPQSMPRTEIAERVQTPIETEYEIPEPNKTPSVRVAVTGAKEASNKQTEADRKRQRNPLPVAKPDKETLLPPEKHVREIKTKSQSYIESQNEVLPWLPAPEDVRPNFINGGDDHVRKKDTLNRHGSNIRNGDLHSNGYNAYKRSVETSVLLRDSKLQMTDLYNSLRPSKLAERFLDLYFREYANAFEDLTTSGIKERNIVFFLLQIVTKAYEHCQAAIELNLAHNLNAEKDASWKSGLYGANTTEFQTHRNSQIETRLVKATQMLPYAREDFLHTTYPTILPRNIATKFLRPMAYAERCMEVCWWMCVLEPPIAMEWVPDRVRGQFYEPFNRDLYGSYKKAGSHLEYTVWPVLRLYKHGPVVSKGIAQGINPYM
ncbi:hypothetical protein ACJMK2_031311 [Sinanodonta woodiana]|uniref:Mitochondria-eating protein C-terminal domain-containing protein n=1 Tax=Sinanodonta woodiana TaxID=1069815 RepID=A0ABD3WYE0_SINWO